MSAGSRSPKRDRHYRNEKSSRRERSRDREKSSSSHSKSSRDSRKQHGRDSYYRSHDSASSSSSRKFDAQRGIDAARNRMRASLNTAITDLKTKDREHTNSAVEDSLNFSDSLSVLDSLDRQKAIEQIQQNSFVPAQFSSSKTPQELLRQKANKKNVQAEADVKMHDKAMFGALWTSKEIERKLLKENNGVKKEEPEIEEIEVKNVTRSEPSIAHERLFTDPLIKKQKWLELFRERRKALITDNNF